MKKLADLIFICGVITCVGALFWTAAVLVYAFLQWMGVVK